MKRKTCGLCVNRKGCDKRTTYTLVPDTYADRCSDYIEKPKPCPFCGKQVEVHGGSEEWVPTFYDPDSGGEPYYVKCICGLEFSMGHCDYTDFVKTWNKRINSERY